MGRIRSRQDGLAWRLVGTDVVVLDELSSKYLQLSGSGAYLWQAIVDGTSQDDLAAALQTRYGIDEQTAQHDVAAFVDDLTQRGLVTGDPA